eukprot:m.23417 g.23417  ORF g.23417 m.23417 type:complete len:253 (-) comp11046_c0_seq1:80-838(-)
MHRAFVALVCLLPLALAQDPAEGWMGYAKGVSPSGGTLTHVEAKWRVGGNPSRGGAFFSPWLGIESSDNLNLIQPVNPWTGNHWEMYNEYFQWRPTHNENSDAHVVKPGDVLHGSVDYNPSRNSYTMTHRNLNDSWSVQTEIPVQHTVEGYKKYTIVYLVYEKVWACDMYPPDGEVTFFDISVEYDNQKVSPTWTTAFVDDNCNNRAHIVDESTVKITWDVNGKAMKGARFTPLSAEEKASLHSQRLPHVKA